MKYFSILILLFSFSSNAAYCVKELTDGSLGLDTNSIESCPSGIILLSKSDYDAINVESIIATLTDLFEFSIEDFAYFNAICLIGFIVGHALGRVNRILGKT
jgi:hypothetical protein